MTFKIYNDWDVSCLISQIQHWQMTLHITFFSSLLLFYEVHTMKHISLAYLFIYYEASQLPCKKLKIDHKQQFSQFS